MSSINDGLIQCPNCKEYFKTSVSFFVNIDENGNQYPEIPESKKCPNCDFEIKSWNKHVVYDPGKKKT